MGVPWNQGDGWLIAFLANASSDSILALVFVRLRTVLEEELGVQPEDVVACSGLYNACFSTLCGGEREWCVCGCVGVWVCVCACVCVRVGVGGCGCVHCISDYQ